MKLKHKKIYIAGPMTGYKNYNFDSFDDAAALLRSRCWKVINPADLDRIYEGWDTYPPEDLVIDARFKVRVMRRDLDAIMECDAIYFLKGWEQSAGVKVERALAKFLQLAMFYE